MTRIWDAADWALAADALAAGGCAAFPTETVYGLGARADDPAAVARIFAAKDRPRFNPLIAHVADPDAGLALIEAGAEGDRLAAAFWPGPLTLVAPRRAGAPLCDLVTAGLATAAVRAPAHPLARRLLGRVGAPVAAPSANPSGAVSPTTAAHVLAGLAGRIDGVLDGGPCDVGLESTIVGLGPGGPALLRPGGLAVEAIEDALGRRLARRNEGEAISAPGQTASHYAPGARLRLEATAPAPGEAWLGFGPDPEGVAGPALNLSPDGDLIEAAARLFAHLRALDALLDGRGVIAAAPVPRTGLGLAINDRLRRAAAPR